jgi:hypothetical protein
MALSLMGTVNAMVTIGPRVYYAMAKNGAFLASAAKVHPRWHTPVAAIVAQGICTMLMTLTPFPQLVVYIGFTLNFFAVMSVASLLIFRRRGGMAEAAGREFRLSADPGGLLGRGPVDDDSGDSVEAPRVAGDSGDNRYRRAGVSHPAALARPRRIDGGDILSPRSLKAFQRHSTSQKVLAVDKRLRDPRYFRANTVLRDGIEGFCLCTLRANQRALSRRIG